MTHRIVVTGIGTVSAFGTDSPALWSALRDGSLAAVAEDQQPGQFPVIRVKGYSASELLGKKGLQFIHPCSQFLLGSSIMALRSAGLDSAAVDPDRLGIVVASNFGGFRMSEEYDRICITEGPRYVSPMEAPNTLANSPASYLAIRIKSRAFNTTISTGVCAGLDAIGYAMTMLRKGGADIVVAGGTEEWNDQIRWHYENAGLLPKETDAAAGMPFQKQSAGLLPGEGSAAVVMERYDDAIKRGAPILGEVCSWHSSFIPKADKNSKTKGITRTIKRALETAGLGPDDIGLICSGANGLAVLDQAEADALEAVFGGREVPVCTVKRTVGEVYGASGLFQLLAAVRSVQEGIIPASTGLNQEISSGLYNEPHEWPGKERLALITAQDRFGGISAVTVKTV
jgi:3-oxoacyl-[acyl-carrier-protein] synthase II